MVVVKVALIHVSLSSYHYHYILIILSLSSIFTRLLFGLRLGAGEYVIAIYLKVVRQASVVRSPKTECQVGHFRHLLLFPFNRFKQRKSSRRGLRCVPRRRHARKRRLGCLFSRSKNGNLDPKDEEHLGRLVRSTKIH